MSQKIDRLKFALETGLETLAIVLLYAGLDFFRSGQQLAGAICVVAGAALLTIDRVVTYWRLGFHF